MLDSEERSEHLSTSAELCRLALIPEQVCIDPTSDADVAVSTQVHQCTARNVRVLVDRTVGVLDDSNTVLDIGNDVVSTVAVTVTNNDVAVDGRTDSVLDVVEHE